MIFRLKQKCIKNNLRRYAIFCLKHFNLRVWVFVFIMSRDFPKLHHISFQFCCCLNGYQLSILAVNNCVAKKKFIFNLSCFFNISNTPISFVYAFSHKLLMCWSKVDWWSNLTPRSFSQRLLLINEFSNWIWFESLVCTSIISNDTYMCCLSFDYV